MNGSGAIPIPCHPDPLPCHPDPIPRDHLTHTAICLLYREMGHIPGNGSFIGK